MTATQSTNGNRFPGVVASNLHELTATLIEAQRAKVFKALREEQSCGKGLDQATSTEVKRLMSMIVSSSQLGRPTVPQDRTAEPSPGPVSIVLTSLLEKPRKSKPPC